MKFQFVKTSIKFKLILLAFIGLTGFSAILIGNLSYFQKSNQELEVLQNVDLKMVQIAHELQVGLTDLNRLFEASVVEMDKDTLAEALKMAAIQRSQITILDSASLGMKGGSAELTTEFETFVAENRDYAQDVISGHLQGDAIYGAFSSALNKREAYDKKLRAVSKTINQSFTATLQSLRDSSTEVTHQQFIYATLLFLMFTLAIIWFIRTIAGAIENVITVAGQIAEGNLQVDIKAQNNEEFVRLFRALDIMRGRLQTQYEENEIRQKRQSQIAKLNEVLRGEKTVQVLGNNVLHCMAEQLGTLVGAFYACEEEELVLVASHAFVHRKGIRNRFALGESLVGQAGLEQKLMVVQNLPSHYMPVSSGLGEAVPTQVLLAPLVLNGRLLGVLELMGFKELSQPDIDFIQRGSDAMAIALHSALSRVELSKALDQTRQQAEALERQQEELRATNEELEEQASVLRSSEEGLQQQQEELRVMNEELEERNRLLDRQKEEIELNNDALERSRRDLQEKAKQLELSGRYKSEFLSTMSHELRTPLNSILILSQGLMENKANTLEKKQVDHARVIHESGRDLLLLINDILDLSKVEEGKLELNPEDIILTELADRIKSQFEVQAEAKGIQFIIAIGADCPVSIFADEQRLMQILRNFLSNAFKFTHKGQIELSMALPAPEKNSIKDQTKPDAMLIFNVRDSGIGIPLEKQQLIFEAFQQVDGTISRKYGGTGLGLTISRKLAEIMGGSISVTSPGENQGSTFSLEIPRSWGGAQAEKNEVQDQAKNVISFPQSKTAKTPELQPATDQIGDTILIVEDDVGFSRILHNLAEEYGFNVACVHTATDAYNYLNEHLPGSVILDLGLPDAPGQQLLSHLKSHPRTEKIPVHVISGNPNVRTSDLAGASEFIAKPFGRDRLDQLFGDIEKELSQFAQRGVLVIEDDPVQREQLKTNFDRQNIACDLAGSGEEAIALLKMEKYGAVILDLDLPDCDGNELLKKIGTIKDEQTHIIIYTARDLSKKQDAELRRYADRIVLKTDKSITRLLNETSLFLHWLKGDEGSAGKIDENLLDANIAHGKRVLLVDDDIRNLYSLSSVLEDSGMEIETASTGLEALDALDASTPFDLILMDIMMPEMDGFEAMQRIRADVRYQHIPIIALTAKAMRDDRARCMAAGANDYMSKPVDTGKLKTVVKMWLQQ